MIDILLPMKSAPTNVFFSCHLCNPDYYSIVSMKQNIICSGLLCWHLTREQTSQRFLSTICLFQTWVFATSQEAPLTQPGVELCSRTAPRTRSSTVVIPATPVEAALPVSRMDSGPHPYPTAQVKPQPRGHLQQ